MAGTLSLIIFYTEMHRDPTTNFFVEQSTSVAVGVVGSLFLMPFKIVTQILLFAKKHEKDEGKLAIEADIYPKEEKKQIDYTQNRKNASEQQQQEE